VSRFALALASGVLAASCAAPPARPYVPPLDYTTAQAVESTADDPALRASPPPPGPEAPPRPVAIHEARLANGLRVIAVERHGFPAVAARLTVDTRDLEDADVGGRRAYLLGRVFLSPPPGAAVRAECDVTGCRMACLGAASHLGDMIGGIARVAFEAGLTPEVLSERLANATRAFDVEHARPGDPVTRNTAALLFGHDHRYGQPPRGDAPTVAELTALWQRAVVPRASTLVVAGDATLEAVTTEAERAFGGWRDQGIAEHGALPPLTPESEPRIVAFHTNVVRQIAGAVVARGPAPGDADADAFAVVGELLGAPLSSMTYAHVRDEMGAAYTVGARVQFYADASTITVRGSFDRDKVVDGVQGLLDTIRALRDAEVNPDPLERAKRTLVGAWRRAMSTDEGAAAVVSGGVELGWPLASIQERPQRYASVTAADVRRVARDYLGVGALRIVLVGDPEFLVTAQALRFGVPVRVDDSGRRK
jgi:zinc protease